MFAWLRQSMAKYIQMSVMQTLTYFLVDKCVWSPSQVTLPVSFCLRKLWKCRVHCFLKEFICVLRDRPGEGSL